MHGSQTVMERIHATAPLMAAKALKTATAQERQPAQARQSVSIVTKNTARRTATIIQAVRKFETQKMQHARKKATQVIHTVLVAEKRFPQEQQLKCQPIISKTFLQRTQLLPQQETRSIGIVNALTTALAHHQPFAGTQDSCIFFVVPFQVGLRRPQIVRCRRR